MRNTSQINRWRLILGSYAKKQLSFDGDGMTENGISCMDLEEALDFLYNREQGEDVRQGSLDASRLTAVTWITKIRKLFPKETVEVLERHALDRYGMTELLTDREVLEKLEPNQELLKTILQLKHLMKGDVLDTARRIVKKVAEDIAKKLQQDIRRSLLGKIDRNSDHPVRSIRNLDIQKTIRRNLKHYDQEHERIMLEQVYFHGRTRRYSQWRVVIAVDESGSMLDSVIHSAVMAGIFARLPMLDTRLVIFDTQVVDLSSHLEDPVATLMSIQLGGGTCITGALQYCESLIENPHRTMVVLVSDLCEGGSVTALLGVSRGIIESGAKLICLTALDMEANPVYDRRTAQQMADLGAHVGAMTPEMLGDFMGKIMNG
ncbi:MAG: VWA domain-containing protein [Lachnospiraceae bacterium]|jgi:Mg-chelatase subunit ChlD|nr:VWA domain-containing protein [Lachnospiraceae bacterium]